MSRSLVLAVAPLVLAILSLSVVGCGGSQGTQNAGNSADQSSVKASGGEQAATVEQFLRAVQQGDRDAALQLLTTKSVEEFREHELLFLTSPVEDGKFRVGKTVQRGPHCFVQCVWTDDSSSDPAQSENLQWMLKEEKGIGWRIFGVAFYIEGQSQPHVINFEQSEELARQQREQAAAAPGGASQQAARPQDPFQSAPR